MDVNLKLMSQNFGMKVFSSYASLILLIFFSFTTIADSSQIPDDNSSVLPEEAHLTGVSDDSLNNIKPEKDDHLEEASESFSKVSPEKKDGVLGDNHTEDLPENKDNPKEVSSNHLKIISTKEDHIKKASNSDSEILSTEDNNKSDNTLFINTLILSEQKVLEMVLSSSPFIQKLKLQKQKGLSKILEQKYSLSQGEIISKFSRSGKKDQTADLKNKSQSNIQFGFQKNFPLGLRIKPIYSVPIGEKSGTQGKKLDLEFSARF